MRDSSESFFPPLCETSNHPPTYAQLPDTLPLLHAPLPMFACDFNSLHGQYGDRLIPLAESMKQPYVKLARVTGACTSFRLNGRGEISVMIDAYKLVLDPMFLALDSIQQQYVYALDSSEKSGATTQGLRPDGIISFRDVLMFKFEAKNSEEDFNTAEFELGDKMADWQPALHGSREYLLCFAVAGKRLRFYAVKRGGIISKPISREFRMDKSRDRLEVKDDLAPHMTFAESVVNDGHIMSIVCFFLYAQSCGPVIVDIDFFERRFSTWNPKFIIETFA